MRAGFEEGGGGGGGRLGAVSGLLPSRVEARRARRREETRPVAWRPFHVLTPILQVLGWGTLRGVLLSRGIPRGCVAQHTVHKEEEEEEEEGNARRTRGGREREVGIRGDGKEIK